MRMAGQISSITVMAIFLSVLLIVIFSTVIGVFSYCITTLNHEVGLRNAILAQDKSNSAQYDKMWKILTETAGVADKYAKDFKEIYPELIAGRYKTGGGLLKFIQERNPTFNTNLYATLQTTIEVERTATKQGFDKVLDLKREHDNLIDQPITGLIVGAFSRNTSKTNPTIVVSTDTVQAFQTGVDNRILGKE